MSAARSAVEKFVRPGLLLALGTGSTSALVVWAIRERFPEEAFECVVSSRATDELALSLGFKVRSLAADDRFDCHAGRGGRGRPQP